MKTFPSYPKRTIIDLDGAWDFRFLGEDAVLEELSPSGFTFNDIMNVPGAFDCAPDYYCKRGVAIYQTSFVLDEDAPDTFLKVGGVGLRARFWIDGREIGFSSQPYSPQKYPSGAMKAGKHIISIAIDNQFDPEKMKLFLPYYDFFAFGGIYRSMALHIVPSKAHIDRVQVRTVDCEKGNVRLTFLFSGELPAETVAQYRFDTESEFKKIVLPLNNNSAELIDSVPDFKLWSPETPNLHQVYVKTEFGEVVETFGIREIKAGKKCILLNGKPIFLKGFNRHESHPDFGPATPEAIMIKDLEHLKQLNCNFIRGCHYQQDQRFLDLCDRMGFLVWEESLGWGNRPEQMADGEFIGLQVDQTRKMVRESINHPCVIFWAFMNEFASQSKEGYALCKKLVDAIREEDASRLITFACSHTTEDICNELVDVISYNTYPGWICDDSMAEPTEKIAENRDRILKYFRGFSADKPIIVSEMGCCGVYGHHDEANAQWSEEFQAEYLEGVIRNVFGSEEHCGLAIWQFNDAKSFLRKGANIRCKPFAENLAGVFDGYRRRKLSADIVAKLFQDRSSEK